MGGFVKKQSLMDLYHIALKIEFDGLCSLLFLGVNDLGVYLRGADVGVSQHLRYGVDVRALGKLVCCVGMTKTMERYVLLDTSICYPNLDGAIDIGRILQPLKHKSVRVARLTANKVGLL